MLLYIRNYILLIMKTQKIFIATFKIPYYDFLRNGNVKTIFRRKVDRKYTEITEQ